MIRTDNVDSFIHEWNNMSDSTKVAIILSHSNGQSLIFEEGSSTNAISTNGKNSEYENIHAIWELEGPDLEKVFLLACNAGHIGKHKQGDYGNVADSLRDLPNVDTVYAFDGSVGFAIPILRGITNSYPPRLSNNQDSYYSIYSRELGYEDAEIPEITGAIRYDS